MICASLWIFIPFFAPDAYKTRLRLETSSEDARGVPPRTSAGPPAVARAQTHLAAVSMSFIFIIILFDQLMK